MDVVGYLFSFPFILLSLPNPLGIHRVLVVRLNNFYCCHQAEFFVLGTFTLVLKSDMASDKLAILSFSASFPRFSSRFSL
jgi:hypothetical protein